MFLFISFNFAQNVGIGTTTPNQSAKLHIVDPKEILQVDTYDMLIVTVRATQELIKINKAQEKEIDILKAAIESLKSEISQ